MLQSTRRYLRAAGSILNMVPNTDYQKIAGTKSDAENMDLDVRAVGKDITTSIEVYGKEYRVRLSRKPARA